VDPKKIESMKDWPHPKTIKNLRGFLGLTGYYCNFVQNYGNIATPLTALLKINAFSWTPVVDQSFQAVPVGLMFWHCLTSKNLFFWNVMLLGKASGLFSYKMEDLWISLENNYLRDTWKNPLMKMKCWLFCM
jgi:hypothetical protein